MRTFPKGQTFARSTLGALPLSHDLSEMTHSVREITACIKELDATDLTAADRTALRSLLDELDSLVRSR